MRQIIFFSILTVFFCQSCTTQPVLSTPTINATAASDSVVIKETLEMPTMPTPSLIINPMEQRGKVVTLAVGDVFAIAVPQGSSRWKVDYSSVFQPLTPVENMLEPGPQGWFFRAVKVGQADIRLTAFAAPCDQPQPCPPAAPISYVFTVDVK
jgi:hypothetical protein